MLAVDPSDSDLGLRSGSIETARIYTSPRLVRPKHNPWQCPAIQDFSKSAESLTTVSSRRRHVSTMSQGSSIPSSAAKKSALRTGVVEVPPGLEIADPFEVKIPVGDPANPKSWSSLYRWYITMLVATLLLNAYVYNCL